MIWLALAAGYAAGVASTVLFIARTGHLFIARLPKAERLAWARKVSEAANR